MTLMGDEPEIGLGDSGEHVTGLQDRLRGLGLLTKQPDGSYDDETETAVRQLQSDLGHDTDGRVTTDTWQALDQRMLTNGLQYDKYAGPGNQHWDQPSSSEQQSGSDQPWDHQPAGHEQWDQQATNGHESGDASVGSLSPDGQWKWNGSDWEAAHGSAEPNATYADHAAQDTTSAAHGGSAEPEVTVGSLSPDGQWKWNGADWEAAQTPAGSPEHSAPAAQGAQAAQPEEQQTPVIPHIDNIHPNIAGDERFSSFHDFLRENAPSQ